MSCVGCVALCRVWLCWVFDVVVGGFPCGSWTGWCLLLGVFECLSLVWLLDLGVMFAEQLLPGVMSCVVTVFSLLSTATVMGGCVASILFGGGVFPSRPWVWRVRGWWLLVLTISLFPWLLLILRTVSTTSRTLASQGCVEAKASFKLVNNWLCGVWRLVVVSDGRSSAYPCHIALYLWFSGSPVISCWWTLKSMWSLVFCLAWL